MVDVSSGERRVLVVDDEEDILTALEVLFTKALPNVRVLTAESGPRALQVLEEEHVDLIVTDFRMPGMDGLAFLSRAMQFHPGIKSVLLTAYDHDPEIRQAAAALGVERFLGKSLEVVDLVHAVKRVLDRPTKPSMRIMEPAALSAAAPGRGD